MDIRKEIKLKESLGLSVNYNRPKKNQEEWYSGKKKMHTIKTQVEVGTDSLLIYSLAFNKGSVHDFKIFKESKK